MLFRSTSRTVPVVQAFACDIASLERSCEIFTDAVERDVCEWVSQVLRLLREGAPILAHSSRGKSELERFRIVIDSAGIRRTEKVG